MCCIAELHAAWAPTVFVASGRSRVPGMLHQVPVCMKHDVSPLKYSPDVFLLHCFGYVGEALADAREAYLKCTAHGSSDDIKLQAHIGLARLELVVGDAVSTRSALARLSEAMRDYPYSNNIEDVIYLLAIQAAFPSTGQNREAETGALEYLDYLRESYSPAYEGAPTACQFPRWDSNEEDAGDRRQDGSFVGVSESWRGHGLHVDGLPAWALQFQIGLLASRMGNSTRGMETMENAFTSYEAWLPRCFIIYPDPKNAPPSVSRNRILCLAVVDIFTTASISLELLDLCLEYESHFMEQVWWGLER